MKHFKRVPVLAALGCLTLAAVSVSSRAPGQTSLLASRTLAGFRFDAGHPADWPWTGWYEHSLIVGLRMLAKMRDRLDAFNLAHTCAVGDQACLNGERPPVAVCGPETLHARTADGTCNRLDAPMMGASRTRLGRNLPVSSVVRDERTDVLSPDPRRVSRLLLERPAGGFKPVGFLNLLAANWIQFQNHDWLNHANMDLSQAPFELPLASDDPLAAGRPGWTMLIPRSLRSADGDADRRAGLDKSYLNTNTHWWDGSQIYGSERAELARLRAFRDGQLRTEDRAGQHELLPIDGDGIELTGFKRNWWVGLSLLHHVFVQEHNAIARKLAATYDDAAGFARLAAADQRAYRADRDQWLFDKARLVNVAVMAKIHTVEWTPAILNNPTLKAALCINWYGVLQRPNWNKVQAEDSACNWRKQVFNAAGKAGGVLDPAGQFLESMLVHNAPMSNAWRAVLGGLVGAPNDLHGVPYSITEEFTSVYRLHSLLPEDLTILDRATRRSRGRVDIAASRERQAHGLIERHGVANLLYSFGRAHPGALTLHNFPRFMTHIDIPLVGTMDMGAVDILRDRERGVPRYNAFRRALQLKPIHRFEDLFRMPLSPEDAANVRQLKDIYGDDVERLDLLVGTLAESIRPDGFGFGETQFQIFILMASRRLQADRFFSEEYYTPETYTTEGLEWIDQSSLRAVILRHYPELAPQIPEGRNPFFPWNE